MDPGNPAAWAAYEEFERAQGSVTSAERVYARAYAAGRAEEPGKMTSASPAQQLAALPNCRGLAAAAAAAEEKVGAKVAQRASQGPKEQAAMFRPAFDSIRER